MTNNRNLIMFTVPMDIEERNFKYSNIIDIDIRMKRFYSHFSSSLRMLFGNDHSQHDRKNVISARRFAVVFNTTMQMYSSHVRIDLHFYLKSLPKKQKKNKKWKNRKTHSKNNSTIAISKNFHNNSSPSYSWEKKNTFWIVAEQIPSHSGS